MHFIIDCDDVLLNWIGTFRSWVFQNHGVRPFEAYPSNWDMSGWLGVTPERCRKMIEQFNASPMFGELWPIDGAVEAVAALHARGHRLTVLTSCSSEPMIVNRRRENLRRVFGDALDRIVCLDLGESKRNWLDVLRPGIWIEDNYKNAMHGFEAGHKTFMMRRRHNRDDETTTHRDIAWVDDWSPIVSLFS